MHATDQAPLPLCYAPYVLLAVHKLHCGCLLADGVVVVQWLEWHLEGIDRCVTPWLVVGAHRPMYVVHPHKSNRIVAGQLPSPKHALSLLAMRDSLTASRVM